MPSKKTITECVGILCEGFSRTPSAATFLAYEIGLDGLSDEQVKQAARAALQQSRKFMPTPGELRELASGGSYRERAESAWVAFDRSNGSTDDPIARQVCQSLGGWSRLGRMPPSEYYAYARRDFIEMYERILNSGRADRILALGNESAGLIGYTPESQPALVSQI